MDPGAWLVLVTFGWAPASMYPTVERFYISGPFSHLTMLFTKLPYSRPPYRVTLQCYSQSCHTAGRRIESPYSAIYKAAVQPATIQTGLWMAFCVVASFDILGIIPGTSGMAVNREADGLCV